VVAQLDDSGLTLVCGDELRELCPARDEVKAPLHVRLERRRGRQQDRAPGQAACTARTAAAPGSAANVSTPSAS
jgi:hypothetical protein